MLAIGIAFVLPVFIVLLNFIGILSARGILKAWRVAILLICVFTAIATPAADVMSMFLLAIPMVVLYFMAVGIAFWHDAVAQRKARSVDSELVQPERRMSSELSPAERYAASRTLAGTPPDGRVPRARSTSTSIRSSSRACAALERGSSVLVAAPTGAGKTIVADFAVYLAMRDAGREGVLHRADEGAEQPEVPGLRRRVRPGRRSACSPGTRTSTPVRASS